MFVNIREHFMNICLHLAKLCNIYTYVYEQFAKYCELLTKVHELSEQPTM